MSLMKNATYVAGSCICSCRVCGERKQELGLDKLLCQVFFRKQRNMKAHSYFQQSHVWKAIRTSN